MNKNNVSKIIFSIAGIIIYLYLSYHTVIFLHSIHKIPHVPRVFMSVYRGPTVMICGNIIFKDYKKGFIAIRVLAFDPKDDNVLPLLKQVVVAAEDFPRPGPYEIRVPRKIGNVFIVAVNYDSENKSEILIPGVPVIGKGSYKSPLGVGAENIRGIDIEINNTPHIDANTLHTSSRPKDIK